MHPLVDAMLEAATQVGHEPNPDFNGARQEGVGRFQLTQRGGLRCSAADAYLHPAEERPNLDVISGAMAARILFDGARAVGVEMARGGRLEHVRAEALEPLGVEVLEDLPVGHDLQDHCMINVNYLTDEQSLFLAVTPENLALLRDEGRGPLSSNIPEAGGFFRPRAGLEAPDVQFHFAPSLLFDEGLTAPADHGFCFGPVVIKPASRGRVMLRAPLPHSKP